MDQNLYCILVLTELRRLVVIKNTNDVKVLLYCVINITLECLLEMEILNSLSFSKQ